MKISIIAAIAKNNVIGINGHLPWYLPADLAHFKQLTLHKTVVMGRKTYESIGKPLADRKNIIITSNSNYQAPNCKIFSSLQNTIAHSNAKELMIIGGAKLYAEALTIATDLYLTFIDAEFKGDIFFPKINFEKWQEVFREEHRGDKKNPYSYNFIKYKRKY